VFADYRDHFSLLDKIKQVFRNRRSQSGSSVVVAGCQVRAEPASVAS
jgi:hypothetical protein